MLPPDNHVHTEWSWDAVAGSMEESCARAVQLGVAAISFTEHRDLTRWVVAPQLHARIGPGSPNDTVLGRIGQRVGTDGRFNPPPLDVVGYLSCVQRCRDRYPALRIRSGVELGEPHWFEAEAKALLATGDYDRVLGSLHAVEIDGAPWIVDELYQEYAPEGIRPAGVIRAYLSEARRMVEASDSFAVLAHIDYPVRRWPAGVAPFEPNDFEEDYRAVLEALARSGRALEVNTVVPLRAEIVRWWYQAGGDAVSFGSDAHAPSSVAHGFAEAAAMVEAIGFRPGRDAHDFWRRSR